MTSFAGTTHLTPLGGARYGAQADESWLQGRGAYGGLVAALLVRAMEHELADGLRLARITTAFCAPLLPGPIEIEVEVVRAGRNVSTLAARLRGGGSDGGPVVAIAQATASRAREHPMTLVAPMPPMPSVDAVSDGPEEHYIPVFAKRFSFRQCIGPRPFSGEGPGTVGGWCRLNEDGPIDGPLLVALLDAWPPAAVGLSPGWCPVASLEMSVEFEASAPIAAGTWLFYQARCERIGDGLADERSTLHAADGTRLASAQQLIALLPGP